MKLLKRNKSFEHKYNSKCLEYDVLKEKYKDALVLIEEMSDSLLYYKEKYKAEQEKVKKLKDRFKKEDKWKIITTKKPN